MDSESPLPPRIVHLLGGLRAVDERIDRVWLQVSRDKQFGHFPTPPYANLYRDLRALGLPPIGVEFVDRDTFHGLRSPDWECTSDTGFKIREERKFWSQIRHAALDDHATATASIAARTKSYLDLLPIRILQLSQAYNQTYALGTYPAATARRDIFSATPSCRISTLRFTAFWLTQRRFAI